VALATAAGVTGAGPRKNRVCTHGARVLASCGAPMGQLRRRAPVD
jgi:hypothetical protein